MSPAGKLRALLATGGMVRAPGVYDGITAKLAEQAGFSALYMTWAGTSMARGFPDFGLLTLTEMAANASMIARAINLPLIADADTGYGNEMNVTRTVQEYERGGVAGRTSSPAPSRTAIPSCPSRRAMWGTSTRSPTSRTTR
jgi:2-methylisocitrate lyase-like PEP mutase family enzyme